MSNVCFELVGCRLWNSAVMSSEVNFLNEINFYVLLIPRFSTYVSYVIEGVLMVDVLKSVYFTSLTYTIELHFQAAVLIRRSLDFM